MFDNQRFLLGDNRLKREGRLLERLSLGTNRGIMYAELRERDNHELVIEMYNSAGEIFNPISVVGSLPPAFCILSEQHTHAKADDVKTSKSVSRWISETGIIILATEYTGDRKEAIEAERKFLSHLGTYNIDAYEHAVSLVYWLEVGLKEDPEYQDEHSTQSMQFWNFKDDVFKYLKEFGIIITTTETGVKFSLPPDWITTTDC